MEYILHTDQLAVGYGGTPLIHDIEIRLQPGHILTLIGPNGAGKSTILKTITKYLQTMAGTVYIGGQNLDNLSSRDLARQVSVVLTTRMSAELMTCQDVVSTGRYPYTGALGILSAEDREKVRAAMKLVHVDQLADRDFSKISDGQRQRVLLARAICQEPQIIVLDEPTSFLDIRYELELLHVLRRMAREKGIAVLMSLHELDLAERISDEVICVRGETIARYGRPDEVFREDVIRDLYGLTVGSYNALFGSVELPRPDGEPEVFVLAGGGSGIPCYRALQKRQIPFVTGVLHENDVDYPVAVQLAADIAREQPFRPIGDAAFQKAATLLERCRTLVNCLRIYGPENEHNRELLQLAREKGLTIVNSADEL